MTGREPRPSRVLKGCAVAGVVTGVVAAIELRLDGPRLPLWTPDSMGYVEPALRALQGNPFELQSGRPFGYPALVLAVLGATRSFAALAAVQMALGIATIVIALLAWFQATRLLEASDPDRRVRSLGAIGLAIILGFALSPIRSEIALGPEAVFPFLIAVQLFLTARMVVADLADERPVLPLMLAVVLVLVDLFTYATKPSWGLGVVTAALPWLWVMTRARYPLKRRLVAALATIAVAGLVVVVPGRIFPNRDAWNVLFLPQVLFVWHSPVVVEVVADEIARAENEGERTFLSGVEARLRSQLAKPNAASRLGFDADELFYRSDLAPYVLAHFGGDAGRARRFYLAHFFRAWLQEPVVMARKVRGQLGLFFAAPTSAAFRFGDWQGPVLSTRNAVRRQLESRPEWHAMLAPYLGGAPVGLHSPLYPAWVESRGQKLLDRAYVALLGLAPLAWAARWLGRPRAPVGLAAFGALSVLVLADGLAHASTFALVHTLEVGRYRDNLFLLVTMGIVMGTAFVYSCVRSLGEDAA